MVGRPAEETFLFRSIDSLRVQPFGRRTPQSFLLRLVRVEASAALGYRRAGSAYRADLLVARHAGERDAVRRDAASDWPAANFVEVLGMARGSHRRDRHNVDLREKAVPPPQL